jgi:hypothetical protein
MSEVLGGGIGMSIELGRERWHEHIARAGALA